MATAIDVKEIDELSTYQGRKRTFPDKWSSLHPQETLSSHTMAKAGFYYIRGDLVKCYYCEKELENWEEDDNVYKEHKDHARYCPFVQMFPEDAPNRITYSQALLLETDRQFLLMDRSFEKWKTDFQNKFDKVIAKIIKDFEKSHKVRKYNKRKK